MRFLQYLLAALTFQVFAASPSAAQPASVPDRPVQFGYSVIFVEDVPATVAFYEKAFGLKMKYMHPSRGYAEMSTGTTTLAFLSDGFIDSVNLLGPDAPRYHRNRSDGAPSGAQLAFITSNMENDWARAVGAGAKVLARPQPKPWGQTVGYLLDANNVIVELCTPPTRMSN